jgi:malate dehydrogenase (oxaloacetate-decarboxylating)
VATGRSDLPNQINNVLAFPGVFRGLLDGPSRQVDAVLMAAAADAIASLVADPRPESVVPDVFDDRLVATVAQAVCNSAHGFSDMTREEPGTEASSDD